MWFSPLPALCFPMRPNGFEQESGGFQFDSRLCLVQPLGRSVWWWSQVRTPALGVFPRGGAEAGRASWGKQRLSQLLVRLRVCSRDHTEPRESPWALSVCLGCHILLPVDQSRIVWADTVFSWTWAVFSLNEYMNCSFFFFSSFFPVENLLLKPRVFCVVTC